MHGEPAVLFTLQTYTHVIPGMDKAAADQVADPILGNLDMRSTPDVRGCVRETPVSPLGTSEGAAETADFQFSVR
jgi:hypothetical protein